jgi:hypothetical protein
MDEVVGTDGTVNNDPADLILSTEALAVIRDQLKSHENGQGRRKFTRFVLAALGSVPWVGGLLGASAALHGEKDQSQVNDLLKQWLEEHTEKLARLTETIGQILDRLSGFGDQIQDRLESPEYLALVRRAFRSWDQADTDEKRQLIRKLLTNACATELCPDDLVRLFLAWIDSYHEAHFKVIREVYKNPGITRGGIWDRISKERPREDSAEADVYKLLIRDLSTGSVIRQQRATDGMGRFLKKPAVRNSISGSQVMTSAFDDDDPYVLTELGNQFVHYTMNEIVPRIAGDDGHGTGSHKEAPAV